jgi:hypothetical protein
VNLPAGGDKAKREFLADASSFSNAGGGDLIFGIEAKDGVPVRPQPLQLNPDQDSLRFEQSIRDGVSPRVPGVRSEPVELADLEVAPLHCSAWPAICTRCFA